MPAPSRAAPRAEGADASAFLPATAAQALLGRGFKVTAHRGELVPTPLAPLAMATLHPSSILRAPDDATRRAELGRFVGDLRALRSAMARGAGP